MKKIKLLLLIAMILPCSIIYAQVESIQGIVLLEGENEPVIGASIKIVGTGIGAITDFEGRFILSKIPASAKSIEVSYVGLVTKILPIQATPYKIFLKEDAKILDEVIVQGAYGAQTKASVTGAISSVDAAKIESRPISNVSSVLEGASSGIQVNSSYGEPGAGASIRIRGFGSVNGSNDPLYVLDGVPFKGGISDINPADIESISVLKDAASSALFGNKAANGVIIITTKKGKGDRINFSITLNQGFYERGISEYAKLDAHDWMNTMWEGYRNSLIPTQGLAGANQTASSKLVSEIIKYNIFNKANTELFDANGKLVSDASILPGYRGDLDWFKPLERYGHRQEYGMNGSGATDKANYYFSTSYLDEKGYIKSSDFQRLTGRVNVSFDVKPWFKTGLNIYASHQRRNTTTGDSDSNSSFINPFYFARYMAPIYPVHQHDPATGDYIRDADGNKLYDAGENPKRPQNQGRNIVWESKLNSDREFRNTINSQLFAEIKFLKDFTFTAKGSLNLMNREIKTYNNAIIGDGKGQGRAGRTYYRNKEYTFQQHLDWNKMFGIHHVNVLLGHENTKEYYNYLYGFKTDQIFVDNTALINFTQMTTLTDYLMDYRSESYLSRIRYNYNEKYYGEFSYRRDGSSKFHKDNRWGDFWSLGGSWVITSEDWMQAIKPIVNDLKLRISYGQVGNDASVGRYGYMELFSLVQNNNMGAAYRTQFENDKIKWEKTESLGIAIEGRFFDRLNLSLEYFDKRSKDLLFDVNLPLSVGGTSTSNLSSTITENIGEVSNKGFEINADVDIIKNRDWYWNIGMNGTYIKNKIIRLPEENRKNGIISGTKKFSEGHGIYDFWMYKYVGVDQLNGNALYKIDKDKYYVDPANAAAGKSPVDSAKDIADGKQRGFIINGEEYVTSTNFAMKDWSGSAMPNWYGSFNTTVSWKDLSLSALFTYSLGSKVIDYNYMSLMGVTANPSAIHKDVKKSWTEAPEGLIETSPNRIKKGGTPRVDYDKSNDFNATSDRFLQKGDYFLIKNITLAYNLPKKFVNKMTLTRINVHMSIENLYTFTSLKGMTPTQSFAGTNYNVFVPARVLAFGINVQF